MDRLRVGLFVFFSSPKNCVFHSQAKAIFLLQFLSSSLSSSHGDKMCYWTLHWLWAGDCAFAQPWYLQSVPWAQTVLCITALSPLKKYFLISYWITRNFLVRRNSACLIISRLREILSPLFESSECLVSLWFSYDQLPSLSLYIHHDLFWHEWNF